MVEAKRMEELSEGERALEMHSSRQRAQGSGANAEKKQKTGSEMSSTRARPGEGQTPRRTRDRTELRGEGH